MKKRVKTYQQYLVARETLSALGYRYQRYVQNYFVYYSLAVTQITLPILGKKLAKPKQSGAFFRQVPTSYLHYFSQHDADF